MAVNSTHPDYDASALDWSRARDVLAGGDAVKAAGEKYLPRLDSQTDQEFLAYRKRASFFNATARTAEGYVGLIFAQREDIDQPVVRTRNRLELWGESRLSTLAVLAPGARRDSGFACERSGKRELGFIPDRCRYLRQRVG